MSLNKKNCLSGAAYMFIHNSNGIPKVSTSYRRQWFSYCVQDIVTSDGLFNRKWYFACLSW